MQRDKERLYSQMLAIIDIVISVISFLIAYLIRQKSLFVYSNEYLNICLFMMITWYILIHIVGISSFIRIKSYSSIFIDYLLVVTIGQFLLLGYVFVLKYDVSRIVIFLFGGINFVLLVTSKIVIFRLLKLVRKKGYNQQTVAILAGNNCTELIRQIIANAEWGYVIHTIFSDSPLLKQEFGNKYQILPENTDINKFIENNNVSELIYCRKDVNLDEIQMLMYSCQEIGVTFHIQSRVLSVLRTQASLDYIGDVPFFVIKSTPKQIISLKVKQLFDYVFAATILLATSPVLLVIALIIKFTSDGPVIFKQKRVGLHGKEFYMFKFRTMVKNAEALKQELLSQNEQSGPVFKIKKDPRLTKIGGFLRKTSLDEFPQFINVLRGEMSIVGPRPPVPDEVTQYKRWQLRRLSMRPGITCIWQVSGRNNISFEEWMRLDLQYIDNWSLKLDLLLCLKTIKVIFFPTGY